MARKALLLSVDFEDWHQLVRRRLGVRDWQRLEPALERQTQATLALLDSLGVRATFFVLGLVARARPQLVAEIARRGHEIACHGDAHEPVHRQTPAEFACDLRAARSAIAQAGGPAPIGYRAPAFSITAAAAGWAYEVLAQEGFAYDSSQHDSPRIRGRVSSADAGPHAIELPEGRRLWELPVAVWRPAGRSLPVGGASYWSLMPRPLVLRGLRGAAAHTGLYLHPQELDPEPLRVGLPGGSPPALRARAALRTLQRELARRRAPATLSAIAERFDLIPYGELYGTLSQRPERVRHHFRDNAQTFDDLYEDERPLVRLLRPGLFRRRRLAADTVAARDSPSVLDVGCGSGRIGEFVLEAGAGEYLGIDFSEPMVALARERLGRFGGRASVIAGDFLAYAPEDRYDVVLALGLFDYLPDPHRFTRRMFELCADGGCMVASFPRFSIVKGPIRKVRYEWINDCPIFDYSRRELELLLGASGFQELEIATGRSGHLVRAERAPAESAGRTGAVGQPVD